MPVSGLSYRNPRLLVLTVLLIAAAGGGAYQILPRMEDPQCKVRSAYVFSRFDGADAERVEALVTEPIERKLREVEHVKTVQSSSRAGISTVTVTLTDDIENVNDVWSRMRDKLSEAAAELPAGASAPALVDSEWDSNTMIVALTWNHQSTINEAIITRWARQLQNEAKFVQGTQHARLYGEAHEEILVEVDPHAMTLLELTPAALALQIEMADAKVAAGAARTAENELLLEVEGEIDSVARLERLPIKQGKRGSVVRLGDIAVIRRSPKDPPENIALINGAPGVALALRMLPGFRIDVWSVGIRQMLGKFRRRLPDGVRLAVLFDQNQYTQARLDTLMKSLFLGGAGVLAVVLLMMGWRAAIPIGVALPLAVLCVFFAMGVFGVSMEQMSFTGLIIALGLLIDMPIIVVDEVRSRIADGAVPFEAAAESVQRLAAPLAGSTMTTILAFMPLVLVPGPIGEFLGSLGATVVFATLSSLLLGLALIPAITAWLSHNPKEDRTWFEAGFSSPRMRDLYRRSLDLVLSRPWIGVGVGVSLPVIGFILAADLDEQFFPPAERDQFQVQLRLPPRASLAKTRAACEAAREVMLKNADVEEVHWFVGTSAPMFYYNMLVGEEQTPYFAQALVKIRSPKRQRRVVRQLQRALDDGLPAAQTIVLQLEQGPPFAAPIELRIYGPDIDDLFAAGERARRILAAIPDITHTRSTLAHGQPKFVFRVDEDRARLLGLGAVEIARQFDAGLEGAGGGSLVESTEELPVRVRLGSAIRASVADAASIYFIARDPLSQTTMYAPAMSMGHFDLRPDPATITRRNGRRCNVVQGFINAGVLPSKVLAQFKQRLADGFQVARAYDLEFGGEEAERDNALDKLIAYGGLLLVLMAATLVWALRSFRLAGVIACVVFLAWGLALGPLWLSGYALGIMAIIGTMGMIGVAVNDSIIVLAALRDDEGARRGDVASIRNVVMRSTRHVVTTTLTTAAGFSPLIIGGGDFWAPVGVVIAGGVCGATVLALFFAPSAFTILIRKRGFA